MNTRSIKFRLVVWYAGLLAGCFVVIGVAVYAALESYLVRALRESQLRRARQIAQMTKEEIGRAGVSNIGSEVEARYAPGLNERFARVSRAGGEVLYISSAPGNMSFTPVSLPPPEWPGKPETSKKYEVAGGHELLVADVIVSEGGQGKYLVESGALMDDVQADLRQWLIFLVAGLPVVAAVSVSGGYFLVKRALAPVDEIAASAERIGSQNLSERLPIAQTGDEIERLSIALNRMIQRLEEAFEQNRRFVADASHELRTPLTVLRGELESVVQDHSYTTEERERLGSVLEEVERLVNIVEGLFAISRLDAGEAQGKSAPFDMARLTVATAEQMSLLAEDKGIQVNCTAPNEVWVAGDTARMKQVVVNLLDNAIKYTSNNGAVELKVMAENGKAVLEVSDNGIGIPRESLQRVFERFYRVDKARSRDQGGAGLGLSIVKSICAAHNGSVEASSTPGQGSIFRVELPMVATPVGQHNGKVTV